MYLNNTLKVFQGSGDGSVGGESSTEAEPGVSLGLAGQQSQLMGERPHLRMESNRERQ